MSKIASSSECVHSKFELFVDKKPRKYRNKFKKKKNHRYVRLRIHSPNVLSITHYDYSRWKSQKFLSIYFNNVTKK